MLRLKAAIVICACSACSVLNPPFAGAACRVQTKAVAANVVAVPVAVSLGVPVAEVAPYYYSYQASPPQPLAAGDAAIDEIAERVVEKLRSPSAGGLAAAGPASAPHLNPAPRASEPPPAHLPAASLVAKRCATCHSGRDPKAGLSLENLTALNCETRLKAVRAVLSEKMPKGGPPLTADEAGRVLEELVGEK